MVYELRALRPIKKGEQIFISYIDNLQTYSARQEVLRSLYKFTCRCPRFSLSPSEIFASDNYRQILAMTLQTNRANDDSALSAWTNDASLPDNYIIAKSMEIIHVMYSDGLVDQDVCNAHYLRFVKAYCALKDARNAKIWVNQMALIIIAIYGDDHGWKKVADVPESTNWWGLRKKSDVLGGLDISRRGIPLTNPANIRMCLLLCHFAGSNVFNETSFGAPLIPKAIQDSLFSQNLYNFLRKSATTYGSVKATEATLSTCLRPNHGVLDEAWIFEKYQERFKAHRISLHRYH